jgi:hypothetical protein
MHIGDTPVALCENDQISARRTRPFASTDRPLEVPQSVFELGIRDRYEGGVGVSHRHCPVSKLVQRFPAFLSHRDDAILVESGFAEGRDNLLEGRPVGGYAGRGGEVPEEFHLFEASRE